jgi:hypothetical protein
MKQEKKRIFYLLSILVSLFFITIFLYSSYVLTNIQANNKYLISCWHELFNSSSNRIKLVETILKSKEKDDSFNMVLYLIDVNIKERSRYRDDCSISYVKLEYDIEKGIYDIMQSNKIENDINKNKILYSNDKLNQQIDRYNQSVLIYNKYISMFPNFFIAKYKGFKKKKYFTIKYGVLSTDPIIKSKELPKWAVGVDTTI